MRRWFERVCLAALLALALGCGDRAADPSAATVRPEHPSTAQPAAASLGTNGESPTGRLGLAGKPARATERGYIGVVIARDKVDVAAKQAGEVVEILVRIGDRVKAGAPLARLDQRPIREALAVTRAELEAARADLARARLEIEETKERLDRRQALAASVAREELESARYAMRRASAARDRADAEVGHQRARLQQLERQLTDATITAPFSGTIAMRYLDPGVIVAAGTPVVRLIASEDLWVRFAVPADHAGRLAVDAEVVVEIESIVTAVPAVVRQLSPELDPNSQMILVEAELAPEAALVGKIHSGLAAWVRL
jgi:RND family efflux transporter MFP subunit